MIKFNVFICYREKKTEFYFFIDIFKIISKIFNFTFLIIIEAIMKEDTTNNISAYNQELQIFSIFLEAQKENLSSNSCIIKTDCYYAIMIF